MTSKRTQEQIRTLQALCELILDSIEKEQALPCCLGSPRARDIANLTQT